MEDGSMKKFKTMTGENINIEKELEKQIIL